MEQVARLLLSQSFCSLFLGFILRAEAVAGRHIFCIFWAAMVTLILWLLHHLEDGLLFVSFHLTALLEMRPGLCIPMTVGRLPLTVFNRSLHLSIALWWSALASCPFVSDVAFEVVLPQPRVLRRCLQRFLTLAALFASLKNNLLLLAEQSMEEIVPPAVSHAMGPYFSPLSLTLVRSG